MEFHALGHRLWKNWIGDSPEKKQLDSHWDDGNIFQWVKGTEVKGFSQNFG